MKININIENKTPYIFNFNKEYRKSLKTLLKHLNIKGKTEVNVIILDDKGIQKVSKDYRDKDKPTDILSFPADYKNLHQFIGYNLLGDIYLSFETIENQAKEFHHSSKREWTYLFTHGLLHLLGYDHKTPNEEKDMNSIAYKVMDKIKVGRDE